MSDGSNETGAIILTSFFQSDLLVLAHIQMDLTIHIVNVFCKKELCR